METIWFALVAFMLAMYVVLDGFDIGAGHRSSLGRALRRQSAAPSSAPSAPFGTPTKSGSSPEAALYISRSLRFTLPVSADSIFHS